MLRLLLLLLLLALSTTLAASFVHATATTAATVPPTCDTSSQDKMGNSGSKRGATGGGHGYDALRNPIVNKAR